MRVGATPHSRATHQRAVRRRRFAAMGVGVVALASLGVGMFFGARHQSAGQKAARAFTLAWERGDYSAMYEKLTGDAQARVKPPEFVKAYEDARDTATTV